MEQVHATCVDIDGTGVLIRGPSGSGKSDLALRLIDAGARLVADDRTVLTLDGDRVMVTSPPEIDGLFEVRGQGVIRLPCIEGAVLGLVVDLVGPEEVERLPESPRCEISRTYPGPAPLGPFRGLCRGQGAPRRRFLLPPRVTGLPGADIIPKVTDNDP